MIRIERLGFTKGVMPSFDASVVPADALWEAHNVRIDESGIVRGRPGYGVFTASQGLGPIQGMVSAFGDIVMARDGLLHRIDDRGTIADIVGGPLTTEPGAPIEFIRWTREGAERLYAFAGAGVYDSTGATVQLVAPYVPLEGEPANLLRKADGSQDTASGPARCTCPVLRASIGQRLALTGNPDFPNTVFLSGPLDATYWPEDQVIRLPDDGGKIVALCNWYNILLILRDRDLWAFVGSSATDADAALVLQNGSTGCIARRSVVDVPGLGVVFLGYDNVYAVQQVTGIENRAQVVPICDEVGRQLLRAIGEGTDGICATYANRRYWLSFPASKYPERMFIRALQNDAGWFTDTGPRVSAFLTHEGHFYGGLWLNQQVVRLGESLFDNTDGIAIDVAFRREGLGTGPARIKRLFLFIPSKSREADEILTWFGGVYGQNEFGEENTSNARVMAGTQQHIDVKLVVDGQQFVVDQFQLVADRNQAANIQGLEPVQVFEARFHPSLQGHFAQVRIAANVPGEDVAFMGYAIEADPRRMQRGRDV